MPLRIAVVVVNYGSSALLESALGGLDARSPELDVVVVDNFTTEQERAAVVDLAALHGWMTVLRHDNGGFAVGVNDGAALALDRGATVIVMLNPDASIGADDLRRLVEPIERDPLVVTGPRIRSADDTRWLTGTDLRLADGRMRARRLRQPGDEVEPWLSGACLAMSAELWTTLGGLATEYFLYWEDVDLSWRAVRAGARLELVDDAYALHAQGGTQASHSSRAKSDVYYYHQIRNRILFAALHLGPAGVARWRPHDVRVAYEILLQGGKAQFLLHPRVALVALRALRDGRALAGRYRG